MKIAVTYENGQIFQHFGHSEQFKIYDVQNKEIVSETVIGTNGQGHSALAGLLQDGKVEILICGGIGGGAVNALNAYGIKVFAGIQGSADEAVRALLNGKLPYSLEATCDHHDHECDDHDCGSHDCDHCH